MINNDQENQRYQPPQEQEQEGWRSCCFTLNPHGVAYFGQFIFSMCILFFCCLMLVNADGDCNKSSAYIGLISFLMGKLLSSVQTSTNAN